MMMNLASASLQMLLNVGSMYFVTYIPTDVTGQRLQGSADLKIEITSLSWRMPDLYQKKVSWTADPV